MQKARRHPPAGGLRPLVSVWFQVLFHSPFRRSFHLSLTVLVHYRSYLIFSLTGWCRQIQTGFLRSRLTQEIPPQDFSYVYRPVTFCGAAFQSASSFLFLIMWVLQPLSAVADRFGLFPVRSPLLGKSLNCFLFLKVLRCFSPPRLLSDKRQNIPAMPGM